MGGSGPVRRVLRRADARSRWRTSTCSRDRQTADTVVDPADKRGRVNLLNWDGKGATLERRDDLTRRSDGAEREPQSR